MTTVAPIAVAAVLGYGALMGLAHRRERGWRAWRALCWAAGVTVAAVAALGPVADHMDFRAHMIGHVLLGMLAPLLLVLAAPVTLALRALPVAAARRVSGVLRSRAVAAATHPVVTAVLTVGGLWMLYRTGLYAASMRHPTVLLLVHVHVFLAGWLFTHSLVGPDPRRTGPGSPSAPPSSCSSSPHTTSWPRRFTPIRPQGLIPAARRSGRRSCTTAAHPWRSPCSCSSAPNGSVGRDYQISTGR